MLLKRLRIRAWDRYDPMMEAIPVYPPSGWLLPPPEWRHLRRLSSFFPKPAPVVLSLSGFQDRRQFFCRAKKRKVSYLTAGHSAS